MPKDKQLDDLTQLLKANKNDTIAPYTLWRFFLRPDSLLLLLAVVLMPTISGYLLLRENRAQLAHELKILCEQAATLIDSDQHDLLTSTDQKNSTLHSALLEPLTIMHKANLRIIYIYTMREIDGKWFFVLDTMQEPSTAQRNLRQFPDALVSELMEPYDYPMSFLDELAVIESGEIFVNTEIYHDIYGDTMGCMAGINSNLGTSLIGVDFDADELARIKINIRTSLFIGGGAALLFLIIFMRKIIAYLLAKQLLIHKLNRIANTDYLTQINNRRAFFESAEKLKNGHSTPQYLAVAVIDVDDFKQVNDEFGHDVGDITLAHVANILDRTCNQRKYIIGRIGGEEFAVCALVSSPDDFADSLQLFNQALDSSVIDGNLHSIHITASIGYAINDRHNTTVQESLKEADLALYEAKHRGKNRVTRYDSKDFI